MGGTVGGLTYLLFGTLNPYGTSPPLLLLSQIVGGIVVGCGGALWKKMKVNSPVALGIAGAVLTLFYDFITNIGAYLAFVSKSTIGAFVVAALPYASVHILTNALIFGAVVWVVINRIEYIWR